MTVLTFPSLVLTREDEAAIIARVHSGDYYCYRRQTNDRGQLTIALFDRKRNLRGYITKARRKYAVLDARGAVVTQGSSLDSVLSFLSK